MLTDRQISQCDRRHTAHLTVHYDFAARSIGGDREVPDFSRCARRHWRVGPRDVVNRGCTVGDRDRQLLDIRAALHGERIVPSRHGQREWSDALARAVQSDLGAGGIGLNPQTAPGRCGGRLPSIFPVNCCCKKRNRDKAQSDPRDEAAIEPGVSAGGGARILERPLRRELHCGVPRLLIYFWRDPNPFPE